jgi:hypothetical protein
MVGMAGDPIGINLMDQQINLLQHQIMVLWLDQQEVVLVVVAEQQVELMVLKVVMVVLGIQQDKVFQVQGQVVQQESKYPEPTGLIENK